MSAASFLLSGLLAAGLVAVHLFAQRLRFLHGIPRSIWLSIAGGAAVAYVFVHVLPELSEGQEALREAGVPEAVTYLEHHAYLIALLGLVLFYGLERIAVQSKKLKEESKGSVPSPGVFWLHVGTFALYNMLIGYLLLHREEQDVPGALFFFFAMALHLMVNDHGLHDHHKARYRRKGRWILSAAVVAGWSLGALTEVSPAAVAVLFAFLAGGIVLNVLKEELPEERESRFWAFALGSALYAALLLSF